MCERDLYLDSRIIWHLCTSVRERLRAGVCRRFNRSVKKKDRKTGSRMTVPESLRWVV